MGLKRTLALAAVGLFVSIQVSSCHTTSDPAAIEKMDEKTFLDILNGPIRDKHPDSDLIAEGHKACHAFAQGQSRDQVEAVVDADMDFDPASLDQFMGAVYGGMNCFQK